MASSSNFSCSGQHRTRLLIGEGNFSFAEALIHKHDTKAHHDAASSLAHSIVATELNDEIHCSSCTELEEEAYWQNWGQFVTSLCATCQVVADRVEGLKKRGVRVHLGVDGTKISETFPGERFSRIHWNCPHDGSSYTKQTLPPIIQAFFRSCQEVQQAGDRVHITLAQPDKKETFYQGCTYGIVRAATLAGYALFRKRIFDQSRYPEYEHVQTICNTKAAVTDLGMREFVFIKLAEDVVDAQRKACVEKEGKILINSLANKFIPMSTKDYSVRERSFKIGSSQGNIFTGSPPEDVTISRNYYLADSDNDSSDGESR